MNIFTPMERYTLVLSLMVVTRSQSYESEPTLNTPFLQSPRKITGWRRHRLNLSWIGYFGTDAPSRGAAAGLKMLSCVMVACACIHVGLHSRSCIVHRLCALGVLFELRVLFQIFYIWERHIGFLEAIVDSCILEPLSIYSLVAVPARAQQENTCRSANNDKLAVFGCAICVFGATLNVASEVYRKTKGRALVVSGPFAVSRHPNYAGEIISFFGFALASGSSVTSLHNLWVCVLMYIGMVAWSVNDIENALVRTYGRERVNQWRVDTPIPILCGLESAFIKRV